MLVHCFKKMTKRDLRRTPVSKALLLAVLKWYPRYKLGHVCHIHAFRSQEKHLANSKGNISKLNTVVYSIVA